jgi:putative hydrolase
VTARINDEIAGRLEEVARVLRDQGADPFRTRAYLRAARELRRLDRPVDLIWGERGLDGLLELPGIGETIARGIRDLLTHGRLGMLDRLRGAADPVGLLESVPGIGRVLARRLHEDLAIDTLEQLESAAHDGRLESLAGLGDKRLAGIRDSLAHRLGRVRVPERRPAIVPVAELLDVDREYREKAASGTLPKIAPRRLNPSGEAWLPILHTQRGQRHYTALYSNTPRAHALGRTRDWVVLYHDQGRGERQHTVLTATRGPLAGRRIVAGREAECAALFDHADRVDRRIQRSAVS